MPVPPPAGQPPTVRPTRRSFVRRLPGVALSPTNRLAWALPAALAVFTCAALLVHMLDSGTEAHLHDVVLAAAVAQSALLVALWRASARARRVEEHLRAALDVGQTSLRARLNEADRIRADLIGTVSHEFRTPLTGIRAAALTLLKRGERLDREGRATLLQAVLEQQERLSRLLENMLTAAQATSADPDAVTEVDAVAAEVAMLAAAARPGAGEVQVLVDPGTRARIDRPALHQVLANLVDNAQQHGSPGAVPIVAGGSDTAGVWITVSNDGSRIDPSVTARMFEPFTQVDGGATRGREGIGMGLYVVRRLVEVHGGLVMVRSDSGWVTVEVRLQAAVTAADAPLCGGA